MNREEHRPRNGSLSQTSYPQTCGRFRVAFSNRPALAHAGKVRPHTIPLPPAPREGLPTGPPHLGNPMPQPDPQPPLSRLARHASRLSPLLLVLLLVACLGPGGLHFPQVEVTSVTPTRGAVDG